MNIAVPATWGLDALSAAKTTIWHGCTATSMRNFAQNRRPNTGQATSASTASARVLGHTWQEHVEIYIRYARDASNEDTEPSDESQRSLAHLAELHEVRTINSGLKDLQPIGFGIDDLIPADRTGLTTARFELVRGEDARRPLGDLRELLPEIRAAKKDAKSHNF